MGYREFRKQIEKLARKRKLDTIEQIRERQVQSRLLPPELREQILESSSVERERVLERIDEIDTALSILRAHRREARKAEQEARERVLPPAETVERLDGSERVIQRRPYRMVTEASLEARQTTQVIERRIKRLKHERVLRMSELGQIRQIRKQAEAGIIPAMLAITHAWRHPPNIGILAPEVRPGRSYGQFQP